jgi:UDP-3-O-[3-hydroxymyristoyl] glucosamine N-acyltransferase
MEITAGALAQMLSGSIEGDASTVIQRPSKIEDGQEGSICFFHNDKYEAYLYSSKASAILVSKNFVPKKPISATLIKVEDVYSSVALLLEKFGALSEEKKEPIISSQAIIDSSVVIGKSVSIGHLCVIESGVEIGENCVVESQVYIGENVKIGNRCKLKSGVKILHHCIIGDDCTIHPNAVIGSDGFGFAPQQDGSFKKVSQIGNVEIGNQVEIGAGTTIDRATMGSTIIENGVKLDNLIQIAHNVRIGENTVIAAQTGIAGSTKIGKNCKIGGQVGISGHIEIADGTQIQGQSGITSSVKKPNTFLFGYPAINYKDYIRSYAVFKKLPELYRQFKG